MGYFFYEGTPAKPIFSFYNNETSIINYSCFSVVYEDYEKGVLALNELIYINVVLRLFGLVFLSLLNISIIILSSRNIK